MFDQFQNFFLGNSTAVCPRRSIKASPHNPLQAHFDKAMQQFVGLYEEPTKNTTARRAMVKTELPNNEFEMVDALGETFHCC